MITDRFGALLEELSTTLKMNLKPDSNNSCMIRYPDGIELRMQPSNTEDILYLIVEVGTPAQGRYRENVFREALKANGLPPPRAGIFCYSKIKDLLLIYDALPFDELNGHRLSEIMTQVLERARLWKDSISRGEIPSYRSNELTFGSTSGSKSGMFGLR